MFNLTALLAPLVLFYQQIKNFIVFMGSWIVRTDTLDGVGREFVSFLQRTSREISLGNRRYSREIPYVKVKGKHLPYLFIFKTKYFFLYKDKFPIIVSPANESCKATYLNIFSFNTLLSDFTTYYQRIAFLGDYSSFYTHTFKGKGVKKNNRDEGFQNKEMSGGSPISNNKDSATGFDDLNYQLVSVTPPIGITESEILRCAPISEKTKYYFCEPGTYLLNQVKAWHKSKNWYFQRDIRWYRGCLLHGKPGGGKSSLITEIGKLLKLPVIIFDLSCMDNSEFCDYVNRIPFGAIVVFEDFDCVFNKRESLVKTEFNGGVSFDCLLNKLSGIESIQNCFVFITTNNIEKIDAALIRDGRIDEVIELPNLDIKGRKFIAGKMLGDWPELVEKAISQDIDSPAKFENFCSRLAIDRYWADFETGM